MLSNAKLRSKMIALGIASLIGMLAIGLWGAYEQRKGGFEQREALIRAVVESAHGQLSSYVMLEKEGKLTREVAQAQAKESLRKIRFREKEYFFIYSMDGKNVLLPPKPEWEGTVRIDEVDKKGNRFIADIVKQGQSAGGFVHYYFPKAGGKDPLEKISYVMGVPEWGWVIGTGLYVDDIEAAFLVDLKINLGVVILLAGVVFGLVFVIGRSVLNQVGGEPADAVAAMRRVAAGDLRVELSGRMPGSLLSELGSLIVRLRETIAELSTDAERLGAASHEISETSQSVADAAHEQSESTQSMAAAMEELTVSIAHISESAQETERHASGAATLALEGQGEVEAATRDMQALSSTVSDAVQRIGSLSSRANEVGSVAGSINDIASQTNLLALNAAIEAARAGEQGRGFAVVADEVRKLAERTTHATVEIKRMVDAIQSETQGAVDVMTTASTQAEKGVDAAERSATMLHQIVADASQASGRVAEVANATREQGSVSTVLAGQVEQVARMVESTSVGMNETAQATQELERIASRLNVVVSRFQT